MLVISAILLFLPDRALVYNDDVGSGCAVKRHLAAFAIVLGNLIFF